MFINHEDQEWVAQTTSGCKSRGVCAKASKTEKVHDTPHASDQGSANQRVTANAEKQDTGNWDFGRFVKLKVDIPEG